MDKLQTNFKSKITIFQKFFIWDLDIGYCVLFVIWGLEFEIFPVVRN